MVDDHLMGITHVIRADEWLSSTPKHALLYQYFGWEAPVWVHLPIILGTDKSKLSKRTGAVSVLEYKKDYVPDALANYLALLGWNPKTEQEVLSRVELIEQFDLAKINKGNPIFDTAKLNWLNSQYLKKMPVEKLADVILSFRPSEASGGIPYASNDAMMLQAVKLAQDRMEKLSDFGPLTEFLWNNELAYDPAILIPKQSDARFTLEMLATASNLIRNIAEGDWDEESIRKTFFEFCESNQIGKGEILWPLRVAVTGLERSPDVFGVMGVLGRKKTLERVARAQEKMGT